MEDLAEDYVYELINRNMIQMVGLAVEGQVNACRVHDVVRDLAIRKAREQKILGIFDSSKQHPNPISLLQGQERHAINNGIGEYLKLRGSNSDNLKLRSLALTIETARLEVEQMKLMYTRYIHLKVLDLTSVTYSQRIPSQIGDLILLKFLGLMGDTDTDFYADALVIPPSIGKLKKLQSFRGSATSSYKLPKEMSELKELRHLIFFRSEGNLNIGGDQTKLQTISHIEYKEWLTIDTVNFTNLRSLYMKGGTKCEQGLNSIAKLTGLRTLSLHFGETGFPTLKPLSSCKHLQKVMLTGKIKDPSELRFLPDSVTALDLWTSNFRKDPMPTLGSLSNLTVLYLSLGAYDRGKMVFGPDSFPCLQYLKCDRVPLRYFQVDDGALPCLKALQIDTRYVIDKDNIPRRLTSLPPLPDSLPYF